MWTKWNSSHWLITVWHINTGSYRFIQGVLVIRFIAWWTDDRFHSTRKDIQLALNHCEKGTYTLIILYNVCTTSVYVAFYMPRSCSANWCQVVVVAWEMRNMQRIANKFHDFFIFERRIYFCVPDVFRLFTRQHIDTFTVNFIFVTNFNRVDYKQWVWLDCLFFNA